MKEQKKITVVIPTFNNLLYLIQCMDSLLKEVGLNDEIVVVDNGSTDGTKGYLDDLALINSNVKAIHLSSNIGFGPAVNFGIRQHLLSEATGNKVADYILLANDDLVIPKGSFDRMVDALENSHRQLGLKKVGAVGPISNKAAGVPNIKYEGSTELQFVSKFADDVYKSNRGQWTQVGFLCGFCMLIKKEMLNEIGLFDEDFIPGGYEDNQLSLNACRAGWSLVNCQDAFVYHYSSRTIEKFPHARRGMSNRSLYYEKHLEETKRKKLLIYVDTNHGELIDFNLHFEKIADCKVINNNDLNPESDLPIERRKKAYQYALDNGFTWMMGFMEWEFPDLEKLETVLTHLMTNPNPDVKAYYFPIIPMFNGQARRDLPWSMLSGVRMIKVEPGLVFNFDSRDVTFEVLPNIPSWHRRYTSVRVFDYRFSQDGWQKKLVNEASVYGRADVIAPLVSETKAPILSEVEARNGISLNMLMGDGEADFVLDFLDIWTPYCDEIIIADTGAKDGSKDIINKFYPWVKVVDIDLAENFAAARNQIKNMSTQPWIIHLDWDESPEFGNPVPPQLRELSRAIENTNTHGVIFDVVNYHPSGASYVTDAVRVFKNIPEIFYSGRVHETFDEAFLKFPQRVIIKSNFPIHHLGFLKDQSKMKAKLIKYERMLKLQIEENPNDPLGFFNLGMQYLNDGNKQTGLQMLAKAVQLRPSCWPANKELAFYHFRVAGERLAEVVKYLPPSHSFYKHAHAFIQWVNDNIGDPIII